MLSVTGDSCNDTFPGHVHRVEKKETRCGVCAGVITLAGMNVTKLHNLTHNEALDGSQPVVRKTFYVLVALSKMLFAATILRNNNFRDTHSRSPTGRTGTGTWCQSPDCQVLVTEPSCGGGRLCIYFCYQGLKGERAEKTSHMMFDRCS